MLQKIKKYYQELPEHKKYFELVTAFLSIPVLLSVFLINVNNLNRKTEASQPPQVEKSRENSVTVIPVEIARDREEPYSSLSITPSGEVSTAPSTCKKLIGPVEIRSPREGERIVQSPVSVIVDYEIGEYCAVVWSYRLDSGKWSEFDDKSIALYDVTPGEKLLTLRVKSIASSDEVLLERRFTYDPEDSSSLSPSPTATESASLL